MTDARAQVPAESPAVPDPAEYEWNARYDAAWAPTYAVMPKPIVSDSEALEAAMTDDERALYEFSMGMRAAAGDIASRQIEAAKPARVQLSRAKGWRLPLNTVVVARPGKWGNPFTVSAAQEAGYTQQGAVAAFQDWLSGNPWACGDDKFEDRRATILATLNELRGKNLACWCKPGTPCHADVLLELANV